MKTKKLHLIVLSILCATFTLTAKAQQAQPVNQTEKLKKFYYSIKHPEVSLNDFLKKANTSKLSSANFTGCSYLDDPCTGGDFETPLDAGQWQGAYGTWGGGDPDPNFLADGLISGDLFDFNAHQTIVTKGTDYFTGIPTVANGSGAQSLRLGNAVASYGTELISKTIKVTSSSSLITFSYAVVFQDPGHSYLDQPAFSVRVFDCATGSELFNVCNLGDSSNKIVSNASNPFFQSLFDPTYGLIAYRDWTNSFIDLSKYIGHTVNIQFTNKDCGQGGHFGYTYLDNVCGGGGTSSSSGGVKLDSMKTSSCGTGTICADYTLGKSADGSTTGTAVLHLGIYQNGNLLKTLNSDTLKKDSSTYCFSINPANLGLDNSLGGFDYVISNNFSLQGYDYVNPPVGSAPDGVKSGSNNDYLISCGTPDTTCKNVCITDNFGYVWRLCYKKQDNFNIGTGTVNLGNGVIWNARGWLNCKDGVIELHAVNPNGDGCASGNTDSFIYRGYSAQMCKMADIHVADGRWRSFCGSTVINRGTFNAVNCGSQADKVGTENSLTPAKSSGNSFVIKVTPNPVQNKATINFSLATDSKVNLTIYNYMMQPVATLINGSKTAGNYSVVWNVNQSGNTGSGLYKAVAIINGQSFTTTIQVVK